MRHQFWKPAVLAVASLSLSALVPLTVCAQDHQDEHRDQQTEHRDDQSKQRDDQAQRDDQSRQRDDQAQRGDQARRGDPAQRDEHHDDNRGDPAAQYRHDHPHASARCHDGFFTTTRDRSRACTKHGGIDVWIAL